MKRVLPVILTVLGAAGLLVSLAWWFTTEAKYRQARQGYQALAQQYAKEPESAGLSRIDVAALQKANPDCVGWLEIPGTGISYPLLLSADNEYYLRRDFKRTYSVAGSIFLDYRCGTWNEAANNIVYGHNMHDGTMFSPIPLFQDQTYMDAHRDIYVHTLDGILHYSVIGANTIGFDDRLYQDVGESSADEIARMFRTETGHDRFLTLSTCSETGAASRDVVIAGFTGYITGQ